jgi:hypothetical protein
VGINFLFLAAGSEEAAAPGPAGPLCLFAKSWKFLKSWFWRLTPGLAEALGVEAGAKAAIALPLPVPGVTTAR